MTTQKREFYVMYEIECLLQWDCPFQNADFNEPMDIPNCRAASLIEIYITPSTTHCFGLKVPFLDLSIFSIPDP